MRKFFTLFFILTAVVLISQPVYAHGLVYDIAYKDNNAEVTLRWSDSKETKGIAPEYFFLENGKVLNIGYSVKAGAKKQVVIKYDIAGTLPPIKVNLINTVNKDWTPFKDIKGIEAEEYIKHLHDAGVIEPKADGKFNPAAPVTRAEFVSMVVKALKLNEDVKNTKGFKDIEKSNYKKEILLAVKYGLISGNSDKTFNPEGKLTLAQACIITSRAFNFKTSKNVTFNKLKQNKWYSKDVKKMFDSGILNTKDGICKSFNEEAAISKANCAIMISRALTTY